jgi:YVTN family beta-propeller protein
MKTSITWQIVRTISLILVTVGLALTPTPAINSAQAQQTPLLMFIENVGQLPNPASGETIRFQVHSDQATLSLSDSALWFTVLEKSEAETQAQSAPVPDSNLQYPEGTMYPREASTPQRGVHLKLSFPDANPQPHLEPFNRLEPHVSFFVGNDPANWHTDVPVWAGVRYVDLYPGLDLEVTSENGQLVQRLVMKEDVAIAETSPLTNLRWQVEGADALSLENGGQLRLTTAIGDFTLPLPQLVTPDGAPLDLSTTPEVNGLEVISPFSTTPPLPSSPAQIAAAADLLYSTFLGGGAGEEGRGVAVDGAGSIYAAGRTSSTDFPTTPGAFDTDTGGIFLQTFIAKLNPDSTALAYATFLGGADGEEIYDLAVDEAGQAYVVGYTRSSDFPTTPGAFATTVSGVTDAFVVKLNPTGTALVYSTYLGSTNLDFGYSIAIAGSGSAYVTGVTTGPDFPTTPGAFDTTFNGTLGERDAFVAKLNPSGSALEYGTYLGGSNTDEGVAITVDGSGNAYVTGQTESTNFPTTPGAFQTTPHRVFVAKLNPTGSALVYGSFLGGNGVDAVRGIAVDETGHAYVGGDTTSNNFPTTPGAFQTTYHQGSTVTRDGDLFVVKFNPTGSGLVYGTYIGGNDHDVAFALAIDSQGRAYVTGSIYSVDFPTTPNAFQPTPPGYPDAFVAKLNAAGSALAYSSYLGGNFGEAGFAIAADQAGNAYITGSTNSTNFPTTANAFDTSYNSNQDAFVTKLATGNEPEPPPTPTPTPIPAHTCAPTFLGTITVGNEPRGIAIDSTRQRVYVANYSSDSVSVIDSNTNTVIQTINGITYANGIAHDPLHNVLWVTNHSTDQVTPIQVNADATAFTPLPAIAVGDMPWGVTYDPVHNYIYVANSLSDSITVINAETRAVVTTITGSNFLRPFHLAANPVTGKVYVVNFGGPIHNVTVLNGTTISKVISLYDSKEPYGLAIDETRNLVYVATVEPHRIVVIGPRQGVPDQFLGWAAFHRGFGNPRRPIPMRAIAVNPTLGPVGDGGHLWATTTTGDGSESNQALFIPKGWGGYFHFPMAQNVDIYPADGIAIDRATNRVYISSGFAPGTVTVMGDHSTLCTDAFAKIASLEDNANQPPAEDSDQIGVEIWENKEEEDTSSPLGDMNGDKAINILDLAFVAARYGSDDPTADLNGDGRVDILDLVIIANNFGQ